MKSALSVCAVLAALVATTTGMPAPTAFARPVTQGRLDAIGPGAKPLGCCPLKHTDVTVDISGFIARVAVRQQFHNPFPEKIEALYVFPLSQDAAVDRMTMRVGKRLIEGEIKGRNAARRIYESAKAAGKVASLLDQHRANVFRQAVANIEPGEQIDITISYSETLDWVDGEYHFDFPMVVGPRYMPGSPIGEKAEGWAAPTDQVPDAHLISPKIPPEGMRAGHDVSVTIHLNAGLPIRRIESKQHAVTVDYLAEDKSRAVVTLKKNKTIPNKDFVLVYQTTDDKIEDALLTHTDKRGKFFTLVIQPPKRVPAEMIVPKEIIFVIDKSGSMEGFPITTAKKAMRMCIEQLRPKDTFNLITFAGGVGYCFPQPVPNTENNRRVALQYLGHLQGSGGTEMMDAIHACLADQHDPRRVRVVCFMTDGYVGNDMEIIDAVKRNAGTARVFAFGIGTSVNRYLLDGIARAGRGEVHYVLSRSETFGAAERFHERIRTPVLTDVRLDFGDLPVEEVYSNQLVESTATETGMDTSVGYSDDLFREPEAVESLQASRPKPLFSRADPKSPELQLIDLFSSKPLVIKGRYNKAAHGTIILRGKTGQGRFKRKIKVQLPRKEPRNELLASLWARAKVEHLMRQDLTAIQRGTPDPGIAEEILGLGLQYRLLTQFTSFVAVEHKRTTEGGPAKTVGVPVEVPAKVSRQGVFGNDQGAVSVQLVPQSAASAPRNDLLREIGAYSGTGLSGRGAASRSRMVREGGGTCVSESAVTVGLKWLASHQAPDGSWSFNHAEDRQSGGFANPGTCPSKIQATALALLPFLGAGQTQMKGNHKSTVKQGLGFLVRSAKVRSGDGDLRGKDGNMLAHAMATATLCEAYSMTRDKGLLGPAQAAVNFIASSQDKKTGGWAPKDGQPPTTLVTAWQLLALKSAHMAYLRVSPDTVKKAMSFLDRVQIDGGARYGQTIGPDKVKADNPSSAAGLLCRMYLGWSKDRAPLALGVRRFGQAGPSKTDAMCNFFATQVMRHHGGEIWKKWNQAMRDQLVESQSRGDETGSWFNPADVRAAEGGRLMQTALNIMILEVYYRVLPIYRSQSTEDDFPL